METFPIVGSPGLWAGFIAFVIAMLALDLGVFHRKAHVVKFKEALGWSALWVSLALIFGAGDYAASMRMPSAAIGERDAHDEIYPGHRWHAVMHTIVAAARANGLRCMDGPYAGFKDTAGLERACRIAQALGFDGKQCIHPAQLETVNAVFSPSDAEVAKAAAIVEAYDKAVSAGQGAATHDGRMIDAANVRMARTILERQRLISTT